MSRSYLLILGDRDAIGWVLREQRMAFPATPRAEVAALAAGDRLFLYATRGAWRSPTRDRGRIIGTAVALNAARSLDAPVEIAGRRFSSGCNLDIDGLVPYPGGLELQPLIEQMAAFPKPQAWSVYLRRALLPLPTADAALLDRTLRPQLTSREKALSSYPSATAAEVS
ncbi:hypothetical protein U2F26_33655 [Micromonospora sp. 4G57]|uniref:EVE domain-containing protein n=1 Tax=Micromonospora sicca TaxID=2202420 RepID=A0ABU5JNW3_9ACTN|nr:MULTISPECIES: hypothetical protein [unclassified Micromonospora]MDZ5447595.1 hypothetical protein [Micromonospora sp. 4G57]MDZ5494335.1 hypothetical protein [Micromonospora sp. 4G53]